MPSEPTITRLGESLLIVDCGDGGEARERVGSSLAACGQHRLAGVTDLVPAFGVLGVHFDPAKIACHRPEAPSDVVHRWVGQRLSCGSHAARRQSQLIELPVCYDGADLAEVADRAGLSVERLIERHSGITYSVGAVGFAPGFAYLEGLPEELHTPRRATPRTRVPAGSVAIGGRYTGVYPNDSPGGWNMLGRTTVRLFDPDATPPKALGVGDRVRMRPVAASDLPSRPTRLEADSESDDGVPVFRVVSPGLSTTLQGLGRPGQQASGVSPGGAMDAASHQLANLLASMPMDTPAIEATLVGPVLEAIEDVTLGLAGALPPRFSSPRRVHLRRGEQLDLRRLERGCRCSVSVEGGLIARAGLGRRLTPGDTLCVAEHQKPRRRVIAAASPTLSRSFTTEPAVLRFLSCAQTEWLGTGMVERFVGRVFRVSPQSDRMGVRCEGAPLPVESLGSPPSRPVTHGVIQVPPDGLPVVLGADRQTLGGYPNIGCVITADLPTLGQLRPGDAVRFEEASPAEAERRRRDLEQSLAIAAAGITLRDP